MRFSDVAFDFCEACIDSIRDTRLCVRGLEKKKTDSAWSRTPPPPPYFG
jgi:hypothetical protein